MWEERKVLIAEELAKGHHDVVTLQEVLERLKFLVILSHCAGPGCLEGRKRYPPDKSLSGG